MTAVSLFVAILLIVLGIVLIAVAAIIVMVVGLVSGHRRDIRLGRLLVIEIAPAPRRRRPRRWGKASAELDRHKACPR